MLHASTCASPNIQTGDISQDLTVLTQSVQILAVHQTHRLRCQPLSTQIWPLSPPQSDRTFPAAPSPPFKSHATLSFTPRKRQPSLRLPSMPFPRARACSGPVLPQAEHLKLTSSDPPYLPTPSSSSYPSRQHGSWSAWVVSTASSSPESPSFYP